MTGFVYFIRCNDRVKIGFSKDPVRRLTKINADAPYPCELLGYADAAVHPERVVHDRFSEKRAHSEWFWMDAEIAAFIAASSVMDPSLAGDKFRRADISTMNSLKAWRYRNRLMQADAAKLLGVTAGFISRVESGHYRFAPERIPEVSRVTGIPARELCPEMAAIFAPTSPKEQEHVG